MYNNCQKGWKRNPISRIQSLARQKKKEASANTFVYSNFNYCSIIWHFAAKKSRNKREKKSRTLPKIALQQHYWNIWRSTNKNLAVFYRNSAFKKSFNRNLQSVKWFKPKLYEGNLLIWLRFHLLVWIFILFYFTVNFLTIWS